MVEEYQKKRQVNSTGSTSTREYGSHFKVQLLLYSMSDTKKKALLSGKIQASWRVVCERHQARCSPAMHLA